MIKQIKKSDLNLTKYFFIYSYIQKNHFNYIKFLFSFSFSLVDLLSNQ